MAKKLLKTVLVILGIILLAAAALILWLSVTEFKPGDVMDVKVEANSEVSGLSPFLDEEFSVISWNIGYAGLGKGSDFYGRRHECLFRRPGHGRRVAFRHIQNALLVIGSCNDIHAAGGR